MAFAIKRKKQGFILPINQWLRTDLAGFIWEIMLSADSHALRMHGKNRIKNLFVRSSGFKETEKISLLWRLLIFEIWHQAYIKNHG